MKIDKKNISIFNWSEISRILGMNRNGIMEDYSGNKYKIPAESIKSLEKAIRKALTEIMIDSVRSSVKKC